MVFHYTYICEITYLWIATIQEPDAMCGRRGKSEKDAGAAVIEYEH
jgi:hypothetical protein